LGDTLKLNALPSERTHVASAEQDGIAQTPAKHSSDDKTLQIVNDWFDFFTPILFHGIKDDFFSKRKLINYTYNYSLRIMDKLTKEEIEKRVHEVAGEKGHLTFDEFMGLAKEFFGEFPNNIDAAIPDDLDNEKDNQ
jgi:hypothetical protein